MILQKEILKRFNVTTSNLLLLQFIMKHTISEILQATEHRTWKYPDSKWTYYQEWNNAVFFHWKINPNLLLHYIPDGLSLDIIDGYAWVSLVIFRIRPRLLPSFAPISNFEEINLRTYVTKNDKPGVYFLSIEAEKLLSSIIAKSLSGLPYQKSNIKRGRNNILSHHPNKPFTINATYAIGNSMQTKTALDIFLTERYCLYIEEAAHINRFEIHHLPWDIQEVTFDTLHIDYNLGALHLASTPDLMHYSKGVQVTAWGKERLPD